MISETAKYRELTKPHIHGMTVDIGCGRETVVPGCLGIDVKETDTVAHVICSTERLPLRSESFDTVYSSHLLEDFADWRPVLAEWLRILKPGGHLIILMPDRLLFAEAIRNGQPPNLDHKREGEVGALTQTMQRMKARVEVIEDRLTALHPGDYSILFVAKKL